ncbi:serine hydrolase domain-containing protein [Nocardia paucivorans]|uniref:serine hydrolase domain-containing protein n=1 Tax=Nocardia paucivorans TaxID=114259 RepID=UPI000319DEDC|nr:serine hydrolase domain-containing protein [Nocardia paucivorans]
MDTEFQKTLRARVARVRVMTRVPSLTVAVGIGGVQRALACSGYADCESADPAAGTTGYRIGSITKTFTAALILLLTDRGEMSLDSTVDRYLPGTPFGHVPVRMLLSHSSGLPREVPTGMWETGRGPSVAELHTAFRQVELLAEPGLRWHYSNLGYAILGRIIETVTGRPYETAIEHTLLDPLHLEQTGWTPPDTAAVGYRLDPYSNEVHREPVMDQGAIGAGGQLWSAAGDLLRWGHALTGGEPNVLPTTVVDKMHTLQVMADTAHWRRGWGPGLLLARCGDHILAGHTGAISGFQAALMMDRDTGITVAVLTNATRGIRPGDLAIEILQDAMAAQPETPIPPRSPTPCPDRIRPLLGRWWIESDEMVFRWEDDGLHAGLVGEPNTSDTRFVEEGPGRFRAAEGWLQGERLTVTHTEAGLRMRWATYPLTRTPR